MENQFERNGNNSDLAANEVNGSSSDLAANEVNGSGSDLRSNEVNGSSSDLVDNEANETSNSSNDVEQKKNRKGFIVATVLIVFVVLVVVLFSSFSKGMSAGKFLGKIDGDNLNLFAEMIGFIEKNEATKTTFEVDTKEIAKLMGENDVDSKIMKLEVIGRRENEKLASQILMSYNNVSLINAQFVKASQQVGIKVEKMTDEFLALNLKEMDKFLENIGVDVEEFKKDFEESTNMTFDEFLDWEKNQSNSEKELEIYEKVLLPYLKIITDFLDKNEKIEQNATIDIAGENMKVTRHYVEINEKMLNELALQILKKAKNDKAFYQLLEETMLEQYKETMGDLEAEEIDKWKIDFKEAYLNGIEEAIQNIVEEMENQEVESVSPGVVISIYQKDNRTIAIVFEVLANLENKEDVEMKVMIAMINEEDKLHMEFFVESKESDLKVVVSFDLEKEKDSYDGKLSVGAKYIDTSYDSVTWKRKEEEKDLEVVLLKFKVEKTEEGKEILEDFASEKTIWLNEKSEEELEKLWNEIEEKTTSYTDDIVKNMEGSMLMSNSTDTISMADFAYFMQEFGDYSDQLILAAADIKAECAIKGVIINNAQNYYMAASGLTSFEAEGVKGYTIPVGYKLNTTLKDTLSILSDSVVAYVIEDKNIRYCEDFANDSDGSAGKEFYGDSKGKEYHFITSTGTVFTLPGYPLEQSDKTIRYYINTRYYYVVSGRSGLAQGESNIDGDIVIGSFPIVATDLLKEGTYGIEGNNIEVNTLSSTAIQIKG